MFEQMLRLIVVVSLAAASGKLAAKLKMPAVLGFLIAGMAFGPHAAGLLTQDMLDSTFYRTLISYLECGMGLMLGSEMVWRKMRSYGKQILVITLAQSLMTFAVVTLAFAAVFYLMEIPIFLSLIFGGIALATAPAPALSIVTEYQTDGPVTRTLIPLAVIDDVIAICVFLTVMGTVLQKTAGGAVPGHLIPMVVLFPIGIGGVTGIFAALLIRKLQPGKGCAAVVFVGVLLAASLTALANRYLMPIPVLNFMLSGMVYSAVFSNMIDETKLNQTMKICTPWVHACFTLIILNLGAPLDYHLILGAGVFTLIYIAARAVGKIGGATLGAQLSHAPDTVKQYLGLVILPHSGVSLVLTGIAISALTGPYGQYGDIVRGTIAAAAVINEIIAVFAARQGFKLAGEMGRAVPEQPAGAATEAQAVS